VPRALAAVPDLDEELEQLYALPLEEFTAARNDLAVRLRKAGQADAADRVGALRKPSVPVWTVNQLARRNPDDVAALAAAGEQLRRAQQEAFRGSGADAVREATAAERSAVRTLTHHAQSLLRAEGRSASQQTLERIATTLRAAAVDPDAASLLVAGRLAGELDSPGFAAVAELAPAKPRPRKRAASERADAERRRAKRRRELQAVVERLERRARELDERLQRAEAAAAAARERAEEARRELAEARAELDTLE
jgi:hypothetical protein